MTTGKKWIPIDNYDPGANRGPGAKGPAPAKTDPTDDGSSAGAPSAGFAQAAASRAEAATDTAAPQAQAAVLDALARERDALADSLLRLRAEFDNFRKRAVRELVEARDRARGELLSDLLPVLDNMERALDAAEHHEESKVLGGVRMTRDLFVDLLRRSGVEEIETVGAEFDPHVHDAVLVQPSDQDEGLVAAVLERGYRQGDRVLRPARVTVSSGRSRPEGSGDPGDPDGPGDPGVAG
jgi:molecular chaperone GrpE